MVFDKFAELLCPVFSPLCCAPPPWPPACSRGGVPLVLLTSSRSCLVMLPIALAIPASLATCLQPRWCSPGCLTSLRSCARLRRRRTLWRRMQVGGAWVQAETGGWSVGADGCRWVEILRLATQPALNPLLWRPLAFCLPGWSVGVRGGALSSARALEGCNAH